MRSLQVLRMLALLALLAALLAASLAALPAAFEDYAKPPGAQYACFGDSRRLSTS
jgi:hypothetical protein